MEEMGDTVTGFYQMGLAFADISRIGNELVLTAKDPIDMITATLGPFAPITSSLNCSIKSTVAFGIFDVTHKNIVIALLAGVSSYFLAVRQTSTMGNSKENNKQGKDESFQAHFAKSMKIQLLYVLPIIITVSAAALPSALGLYWFVSNSASYGLDVYMKRKLAHLAPPEIRGEAYDVIKEVEEDVITIEKGITGKK
jgi:hypothetical protein